MYKKLDSMMERFSSYMYENPFKILLVIGMLLALPISYLPQIKMDTSTEGFMHPSDPVLINYNKFRAAFGRDELIILAIKNDDIFSLDFLQTLRDIHHEIEDKVPYIDKVDSLLNVRDTRGDSEQLIVEDLMKDFPTTKQEIEVIKRRVAQSHFYKNLFISDNGKMTTIIVKTDVYSHIGEENSTIEDDFLQGFTDQSAVCENGKKFLTDQENNQVIAAIEKIADKYRQKNLKIYIAGSPVVNNALKTHMMIDMAKFMSLTFLIVLTFLYLTFRRVSAVFYPLIVIILSLLATVGTMAWAGVMFKIPTQILPSLLIAVSVGATVHVLSIFFDEFNKKGDKKSALIHALKYSGLAIAMTSVTTAIGVGSFAGSELAPFSDLGIFSALCVMISLILTLTFLPVLLTLTKLEPKSKKEEGKLDILIQNLALIPVRYTKSIFFFFTFTFIFGIVIATKIVPSYNPLLWFQKNEIHRVSTKIIDKEMKGTTSIEVIIDSKKENAWIDPEKLAKLDVLSQKIERYKDNYVYVGKVFSLATITKEINRALHDNDETFYMIPNDKKMLAQEVLLFENTGSDDLEDVVDSQFSKVRVTIKIPWVDAIKAKDIIQYIHKEVGTMFPEDSYNITGMVPLLINTFSNASYSSIRSYGISALAISLMMMLVLASFRLGLISMIPNIIPIIFGLILMYIGSMALDIFTLLIGSIAIGIVVDDTIHFMYNFKRYFLQYQDSIKALEKTFRTTGKAMLITTIVLTLGFYSYSISSMSSVENFGLLTGSIVIFALVSDFLLAPVLMILISKRGWIR